MAAYRRKQQQQQDPSSPSPISYSFHEELKNPNGRISISSRIQDPNSPITQIPPTSSANPSLAAKAIKASSAHMDSSLSSAYVLHSPSSSSPSPHSSSAMDSNLHEYTSMKNLNESKHGFWGSLARKAKAILDDDNVPAQSDRPGRTRIPVDTETGSKIKYHNTYRPPESYRKSDNPTPLQKGLGAIASSLTSIGGAIGNALEEGLTVVENRTADIIQNRKLHIRKKGSGTQTGNQANDVDRTRQQQFSRSQVQPQTQTDQNIQLKASRDVAMAMAAKAKLLLRELKTVKSDLAFAKDRCAQLEEENRYLRENREKGNSMEDDDLIRLQLETLLAEKARLAQENSVFARENRFLREVVEYHQLTMQDVVYLNEGTEEVTEVYPISMPSMTNLPSTAGPLEAPHNRNLQTNQHVYPVPMSPLEFMEVSKSGDLKGSDSLIPAENIKR